MRQNKIENHRKGFSVNTTTCAAEQEWKSQEAFFRLSRANLSASTRANAFLFDLQGIHGITIAVAFATYQV